MHVCHNSERVKNRYYRYADKYIRKQANRERLLVGLPYEKD